MGVNSITPSLNHLLRNKIHNPESLAATAKALTNKINAYLDAGRLRKAVSVLFASAVQVPYPLYARLFQLCSSARAIVEARKVESHLVTNSPTPPVFLLNRAIEAYGKCGCLNDARGLFDEMPCRDGGSWNAMITAYAQGGCPQKALELFNHMNGFGISANEVTFASVLGSCANVLDLWLLRQIHGLVTKYGFSRNVILGTSLVDAYGKCRIMSDAIRSFNEIPNPNSVSWNVIIRRYLEVGDGISAVAMFFKMFQEDVRPLNHTFSNALVACSSESALYEGLQIHGALVKMGFEEDEVISSSLIDMYVKCGNLEDAHQVFDQPGSKNLISWTTIVSGYAMSGRTREARELFNEMPERNVISWNAMLVGYTRFRQWEEALDFVYLMRKTTKEIDHVSLCLILNVCAGLLDVEMGKQVHGYVYRHGFSSNIFVGNAILYMYGKCGNLRNAKTWFCQINWRDTASWNALLSCYSRHFMSEQAMIIFSEMQCETTPSKFTFVTILAACADIFALQPGKEIHGFMIRNGHEIDVTTTGALVDMYSKCRCIEYALRVFKKAPSHDIILWNSIILGCSHNGKGREAIELFWLMEEQGIYPDHVTFKGVLHACICEGLVELGRYFFNSMSSKYYVMPRVEHYDYMIELYSRYGFMDELEHFVKKMQFEPTLPMLTRIFDACKEHGSMKLGNWVAKRLNELDSFSPYQAETSN